MARSFPQTFDLRLLKGPRAQQFTKPEDAFQQLVGDALKDMAGPYAHVSPTRGRDGSIDAFVVDGASLTGAFKDLPLPLIVECKTHDDAAKGLNRNILGQWALMEGKLEAHALNGWKDLFEPWLDARGYAYCVSAQIPNEQVRQKLRTSIETFFSYLPSDHRPPINSIRVIDWSDLRQWLETSPRVSDSWLGVELELILDHETYLDRLSGFREYLLPSKLEFVPPPPESTFHPARVLAEIEDVDQRHSTLLVGAGGIGKTRTVIEVGTLAANAGWRVLHVLPDEPGVETEDIAQVVLPYAKSRTLLVFDYIDQMQRLDLGSIRRSLIPSAWERGIQLRLLANCRPGWMEIANPERDELFGVIELRPTDAHKATLIETMASRIAPTASSVLGKNEVIRLCGTRAIIALLIARELESRALANLLEDVDTAALRPGDLVQWLRRRLEENALSVKHDKPSLVPQRPEIPMVAAAAALACAPETRETLVLAAESAYKNLLWPTATEDARFLVDLLLKFGWLEAHGMFDSTPHDVVADEVLDQTMHSEAIIFERELTAVLACVLTIPRGIGRLATALRRIFGAVKTEAVSQSITLFLGGWLKANAAALGEVLQAGDPDITGYALGALLSGPPWEESAIQEWEKLFLPWLSAHSTKEEARHLLYKGLKSVDTSKADLVSPALTWLSVHRLAGSATFVLSPLLDRDGVSVSEAEQAIRFTVQWLERHHGAFEAEFVLHSLLRRNDLEGDQAKTARTFALQWLEPHHDALDAQFVLQPLLDRSDLEGDQAKAARTFALQWLEPHHDALDAGFVLPALLKRRDLEGDEAKITRALALQWLELHHSALDAQFVLQPLLDRNDLEGDEAKAARALALQWLEAYHDAPDAGFVLPALLRRRDLEGDEAKITRAFALQWLELHHDGLDAGFVLKPLLDRNDLEGDEAKAARTLALQWLEPHHEALDAQFVLKPLLDRSDLEGDEAKAARTFALQWLEPHHEALDAGFVLPALLKRRDLEGDEAKITRAFALQLLELHHGGLDAQFVLKPLLDRNDLEGDEAKAARALALQWLEPHHEALDAQFVLPALLKRRDLEGDEAKITRAFALQWLEVHYETLEAKFVLHPLLDRGDLEGDQSQRTREFALRWLEHHHTALDARFVVRPLLDRGDLEGDQSQRTREFALRWLEHHHDALDAGFVLPPLLSDRGIEGNLIRSAVRWLDLFYDTTDAEFVLKNLFRRSDIPIDTASNLFAATIQRLRLHIADDEATFLLRWCLNYRSNDDGKRQELVSLALKWLDLHSNSPVADFVWNGVLRHADTSGSDWITAASHAVSRLRTLTNRDKDVDFTIVSLLMRPHLLDITERENIVGRAIELLATDLHEQARRRMSDSLRSLSLTLSEDDPLKSHIDAALGL